MNLFPQLINLFSPFWAYVATYHWCDSQLFGCFSVCFFVCLFFVSLLLLSCTNNNQGKQTESSYISCGLVQCYSPCSTWRHCLITAHHSFSQVNVHHSCLNQFIINKQDQNAKLDLDKIIVCITAVQITRPTLFL